MARKRKTRSSRRKTKSRSSRSRKRKKPAKKSELRLILMASVIFIVAMSFVLLVFNQLIQKEFAPKSNRQAPQQVITDYTVGGECKRNIECFWVSCKSDASNIECVNTQMMMDYYKDCKAYWDVNVENQDFDTCACIDGYCRET